MACTETEYSQTATTFSRTLLFRDANNFEWWAGSFAVGGSGINVCKVAATFHSRANSTPSPDSFRAEMYSNNTTPTPDEPGSAVTNGVSDSVTFTDVPTGSTPTEIEFPFSGTLPALSASTIYWVVIKPDWTIGNSDHCSASYGAGAAGSLWGTYRIATAEWSITDETRGPTMKVYKETAGGGPTVGELMACMQPKSNLPKPPRIEAISY